MTRPSLAPSLPWLLLLASCSSPPMPPGVDESRRRPVNNATAVELQSCRNDLANTRILVTEAARNAEAGNQAMTQLARQQQLLARSIEVDASARRNLLVHVLFPFAGAEVALSEADATRIATEARAAPLIMLRGRTDGTTDSRAESAIARQRAAAVEAWLISSGVDHARIRTTWQPIGDHAADNDTLGGRTLNRRVEIEIYRAAPIVLDAGAPAPMLGRRGASR